MLTLLTTVRDRTEAALLVARLHDAGIPCMRGGGEGPRGISRSAREVYVDEASLPRAQEILEEDRGGFDEKELARLSEEAGQRWAHEDSPAVQGTAHTADVAGDVVQVATPTKGHRVRHAISGQHRAGWSTSARSAGPTAGRPQLMHPVRSPDLPRTRKGIPMPWYGISRCPPSTACSRAADPRAAAPRL